MKKILLTLLFAPLLAYAQYIGPIYNPNNVAIKGGTILGTTISKVTITAPATSATLTIANGKTFTASNTLTFTGTDSSSVAFGAGGTVLYSGGALGTPSSGVATNLTGTAAGLTAGTVTTNANLTGAVTSVGNAASLGSFSSANLSTALTDETGSGVAVFATTPTLVAPVLGVATATSLTFGETALNKYQQDTWTPAFTGLTVVEGAGSVAYSGQYTVIGNVVIWSARIQPSGGATTASVAGTTFINNMPYVIGAIESTCSAANSGTLDSYGNGVGGSSTDNMFTPTWGAVSNGIIISGMYFK